MSSWGGWLVVMGLVAAPPVLARRAAATPPGVPDVDIVAAPLARQPPPPSAVRYGPGVSPELRAAVDEALRAPALRGAKVGLVAVRVSDGQPLLRLQDDLLLNPASCTKLATSSTALRLLRPEFRFRTEYLVTGTLEGTTLKGDLVVRGLGDPTLTEQRLYGVAAELSARGLTAITGDVVLDDTYFDAQGEGPGWEQETLADRAYAAPVGALSIGGNTVAVWVRPGENRGAPVSVQLEPPGEQFTVENRATTGRFGRRLWVHTQPDGEGTRVVVQGVLGVQEPAERVVRRIYNPTAHFGGTLRAMLRLRGIELKGRVRAGVTPESARQLLVDQSEPLKEIITILNHHSSNFIAEMLLKTLGAQVQGAPGTTAKGLAVVQAALERDIGIAPGSYIMGNGSGLNDVNRFSAQQLVMIMRAMAQDPTVSPEFMGSLGVAGASGTLSHRMVQTAAERHLRGKTGTLLGVSALTGYLDVPNHGLVAFSILINGLAGPTSAAWDVQDRIGAALAGEPDPGAALARRSVGDPAGEGATGVAGGGVTLPLPGGGL